MIKDMDDTQGNEFEGAITNFLKQGEELLQKVRMARGTRDITPVEAAPNPETLRERIRAALLVQSRSIIDLARAIREPVGPVNEEMKKLRQEGQLFNVGSEDFPLWTWKIGDDTTSPDLRRLIAKLISERPMTLNELAAATGARKGRVSGQLVEIQRTAQILDLGNAITSRWFLVSEKARDARLPTKAEYRRNPRRDD